MSCAITKPFAVSEPFDSDPDADLIIQSCDNFEFRVRKAILSLASPVFKDMFSLPQPVPDGSTPEPALPSIQLSESGLIIDSLLRYCYPVDPPLCTNDFDNILAILSASEKYDMDFIMAKLSDHLKTTYANDPRFALLRYMRAYDHQQTAEVRRSAWDCLRFPLASLVRNWRLPASSDTSSLPNLIIYHQAVSSKVGLFLSRFENIQPAWKWKRQQCSSCDVLGTFHEPKWWTGNLVLTVSKVYAYGPISLSILGYERGGPNRNDLCINCKVEFIENWPTFENRFNELVENEARKVQLSLSWSDSPAMLV